MVKKNVLTPVLAGVLGLSIVGSGVGYYVLNKDGAQKTKSEDSITVSPKLSVMAENISNTIDKAQDIANGDVDYACEGSVELKFGTALTKEMDKAPEDLGMTISSRQKGGNEGADLTFTYGGKTLMTLNEVYKRDGENEEMYLKVPEMSDAYLKINKADAKKYVEDQMDVDFNEFSGLVDDIDFDAETFEADLKEYEQVVKDNFPEVKEEGKKTGDIDGVSYEYTSKSYEITSSDAQKMAAAVLEKAKTDENIKKMYDDGVDKAMSSMTQTYGEEQETPPTYEEAIDELLADINKDVGESDDKVFLETYENGDGDFMGFTLTPDGQEGELRYIMVSSDEAEGIDMYFNGGDDSTFTAYGALKSENDTVNGTYTMSMVEDGEETMKLVYTVSDVKNVGENFSGTIRIDANTNEYGEAESGWFEFVSNSTEDNVDVSFNFGINGEDALTLTITNKKTEASDIELPASDAEVFDALDEEQLNKYLEGCDTEGFTQKMKDTMGEDVYNEFFNSSYGTSSYSYDDGDYEYDFDDDDFDWSQFDVDTIETEGDQPA